MKMKKITLLLLAAVLALTLAACGGSSAGESSGSAAQQAGKGTSDTLIVYFSAANTNDKDATTFATPMGMYDSSVGWMANVIKDQVGGDVVQIVPVVPYTSDYDNLVEDANLEMTDSLRPEFEDLGVDPTSYKTIFIGYPIWWGRLPMIMETFFDTYDFSGKTIVPFNMHNGSEDAGTYGMIQEREPDAKVLKGLAIRGDDVETDEAKNAILEWLKGLELK